MFRIALELLPIMGYTIALPNGMGLGHHPKRCQKGKTLVYLRRSLLSVAKRRSVVNCMLLAADDLTELIELAHKKPHLFEAVPTAMQVYVDACEELDRRDRLFHDKNHRDF